jgi:calreticulin
VFGEVYFVEKFDDDTLSDRWISADNTGEWVLSSTRWYGDEAEAKGIQTSQDAKFYAISADMGTDVTNEGKDLVIQFQVKFPQKIDCGCGYIKLLPGPLDQSQFNGESKYGIMFGPDICGSSTKKVHVIFNYNDENLLTNKNIRCETDETSHVYTLIVRPDNTYEVRIDGDERASGSLYDDWDFLLPEEIEDPNESKPDNWVDDAKIPDPDAVKPEDWVDDAKIADPEASVPEDWDEELDGEWEAPLIDNPDYQGAWRAPLIDNPDYIGEWVHPKIPNPDFVDDRNVYLQSGLRYVGIELWQVKSGTHFDNIIVTDSIEEADKLLKETFSKYSEGEKSMFDDIKAEDKAKKDEERKAKEEERKKQEEELAGLEDDDFDFDDEELHDEL